MGREGRLPRGEEGSLISGGSEVSGLPSRQGDSLAINRGDQLVVRRDREGLRVTLCERGLIPAVVAQACFHLSSVSTEEALYPT